MHIFGPGLNIFKYELESVFNDTAGLIVPDASSELFGLQKAGGTIDLEACLTHTSTVEPTLAPVIVERSMTTRAAASVFSTLLSN